MAYITLLEKLEALEKSRDFHGYDEKYYDLKPYLAVSESFIKLHINSLVDPRKASIRLFQLGFQLYIHNTQCFLTPSQLVELMAKDRYIVKMIFKSGIGADSDITSKLNSLARNALEKDSSLHHERAIIGELPTISDVPYVQHGKPMKHFRLK